MSKTLDARSLAAIAGRGLALKVAKKGAALTVGAWATREELRRIHHDPKASKPMPGWVTAFDKPRAAAAIAGFGLAGAGIVGDVARHTNWGRVASKAMIAASKAHPALRVAGMVAQADPVKIMKAGFVLGMPMYDALGREVTRHYEAKGWDKGLGPVWKHALAVDGLPGQERISKLPGMGWYHLDPVKHSLSKDIAHVPSKPWYDQPMGNSGVSPREAAVGAAIVLGPPAVVGYALGKMGVTEHHFDGGYAPKAEPMAATRARSKQAAPRYNDKVLSPRSKAKALAEIGHPSAPRVKAAEKMVATKVKNGVIQPFKTTRANGGTFASPKLLPTLARNLPTAANALRFAGAATTVGALGVVGYNLVTGKHAGDREEAMKRDNDPGRLAASGIASATTTAVANRVVAGVAARTAAGIVARAAGPLAIGALAGYGAYKGYAEEGAKGAVRGAVSSLTMGLADKAMDKVLGPKRVDTIGPMLKAPNFPGLPMRSDGFNRAQGEYRTAHSGPAEAHDYKDNWDDKRGRHYTRRDMSVRKTET